MRNLIKVSLIPFLISNNLMASELINEKHFFLEIESLNMVMRYEKFKNPDMYKNNQNKYYAIPIDQCNCLVKVKKDYIVELFNVDICNKIFFKK